MEKDTMQGVGMKKVSTCIRRAIKVSKTDAKKKLEDVSKVLTIPFTVDKDIPIRIAHVVYPYFSIPPKGYGGVERQVYSLASEQAKRGYSVIVLAHPDSNIPNCGLVRCFLLDSEHKTGALQASYAIKLCSTGVCNVVHDHTPWGRLGRENCNVPVIRTLYGDPKKYYVSTIRKDVKLVFTTKGFASFYGYPNEFVVTQATCENPEKISYNFGKREDWVLFIGQMNEIKGPHVAIEWALAMNRNLLMVGPITDTSFFNSQILPLLSFNSKNIEKGVDYVRRGNKRIAYCGEASRENVWSLLLKSRLVVVPSMCEDALSMVVQEGMLTGCPVIAIDAGGIKESMAGDVGGRCVSSLQEVLEYERTIDSWYSPKEARDNILATRTPDIMFKEYDVIYRRLLDI